MIDRAGALWAYRLGAASGGRGLHCPFEPGTPHAAYWTDGRNGKPFRGLAS